jgi:hypothetical protein
MKNCIFAQKNIISILKNEKILHFYRFCTLAEFVYLCDVPSGTNSRKFDFIQTI